MDDKPVNLIVMITVPLWESEVESFKQDLEYELGVLLPSFGGVDRDVRVEMVTNSARPPTT